MKTHFSFKHLLFIGGAVRFAKSVVRSARDCLYVLLCHAGRRSPYRHLPADPCEEEGD